MPDLAEQITCVRRELNLRRRVYPRWVAQKRMTQKDADDEITRMEAVLATLEALRDADRLIARAEGEETSAAAASPIRPRSRPPRSSPSAPRR